MPLLSGPGAIAVDIVFTGEQKTKVHQWVMAIVILLIVATTYVFLRLGRVVARLVGATGVDVVNKIMGMIVLAIAIEFLYCGFSLHFPGFEANH